jgi:hypothetical protein
MPGRVVLEEFGGPLEGWGLSSSNPEVGWFVADREGGQRLTCASPVSGTYDHGPTRARAARTMALSPGAERLIASWEADLDDGESCVYDDLIARLDGTEIGRICASGAGSWSLDVRPWASRVATLELIFETRDGLRNDGQGVSVDDIVIEGREVDCR